MELRRIYIVANENKEGLLRALAVLKAWCQLKDIEAIPVSHAAPARLEAEGALVVAFGGDGTVLRAASIFADSTVPILGANLGSLGFLTQVQATVLTRALEEMLRDRCTIEERMRLSFAATNARGTVLNDIVVAGGTAHRFCELELLWSDGEAASFPGDGLIISTATGSTAYSLSAGGPIIVPPADCILASPLAAHKLGLRPVIFPAEEVLRIRCRTAASLFADGDHIADLPPAGQVTIERAGLPTRLVRLHDAPPFFQVLAEKLNWGDTVRRKKEK